MARPVDREAMRKSAEYLTRVGLGQKPPLSAAPGDPDYDCAHCQDTAFEVVENVDGTRSSKRCRFCRDRVDGSIRGAKAKDDSPPADEAPRLPYGDDAP